MASKKMNVTVWLIKSAEIDVINQSCLSNLVGQHFDLIYTMPYAMCLNAISEIFSTLKIEDDKNIVCTTRFSNIGLVTKSEMKTLQYMLASFSDKTPNNAETWQKNAKNYFELSVSKATASINKTFDELAKMPGNSFTILVVNNDKMPLLELITGSLDKTLNFPSEGELLQLRFEGTVSTKNANAKLVYASFHPVP
ncbi:MAG: hypothetical protein HGB32_08170 [Geobacteraceae bacterium]|nr:hypothetical protein [Geobacteraceae bacterium]NTW80108.1 hypothetical protein [Geobacteraceae bacterium]